MELRTSSYNVYYSVCPISLVHLYKVNILCKLDKASWTYGRRPGLNAVNDVDKAKYILSNKSEQKSGNLSLNKSMKLSEQQGQFNCDA